MEVEIVPQNQSHELVKIELDTAISTAKQYPRDISATKNRFLQYATCDQETAASCFYAKPVDGKNVEGPSIRVAEIIAATYGNIQYGSRVLEESEKFIKVQGVCKDLEMNISYTVEVVRSIWSTRNNRRYGQNMIETTIKAAAAIAVRDAIFKVVPLGLFKSEMEKVKAKSIGKGDGESLLNRCSKAIAYFENMKVPKARILSAIEVKSINDMNEEHLVLLTGYRTALNDGEVSIDEIFPPTPAEEKTAQGATANQKTSELFDTGGQSAPKK